MDILGQIATKIARFAVHARRATRRTSQAGFKLVPAVFALYGWSAAAQSSATYTFTGPPLSTDAATCSYLQHYGECIGGSVTATISFSNLPLGYTGWAGWAGTCYNGLVPCPAITSFTISGPGATITSATPGACLGGNYDAFQFVNGSIVFSAFLPEIIVPDNIYYLPDAPVCVNDNALVYLFVWSGAESSGAPGGAFCGSGFQSNLTNPHVLGQTEIDGVTGCDWALTVLGTGGIQPLQVVPLNPFAPYASGQLAPGTLNVPTVMASPPAASLAADGESAVVLALKSQSNAPVTFSVSASDAGLPPGAAVGSLGAFDPGYLWSPQPVTNSAQSYQVTTPTSEQDAAGNYTFLALLWAPNAMPVPNVFPSVSLAVGATQEGGSIQGTSITLMPPPLLLVHGIWSDAKQAGFSTDSGFEFNWFISTNYPNPSLIYPVDYGGQPGSATDFSYLAFSDPRIQNIFLATMSNAVAGAAAAGMAARTVDVVAHSMGGLVTRYFLSTAGYLLNPALLPNPVHKLITIGTPHLGTLLATALAGNLTAPAAPLSLPGLYCVANNISPCQLGNFFNSMGKTVDTGVLSLEPGSSALNTLSSSNQFSAVEGVASFNSVTELLMNEIVGGFLPQQTVESILGTTVHDTIVPGSSQDPPGAADTTLIPGIEHINLCDGLPPLVLSVLPPCSDTGEPLSQAVWNQAYWWLTGGTGSAPASSPNETRKAPRPAANAPLPVLDLTGYSEVAATNVVFQPATGSILTINSATNIAATSSTKTITEVLLLQTVADPTDTVLLYSTQSPFTISITPTRLGTASFVAIAVFSDNTFAMTTLSYTLETSGSPYALNLLNTPVASMTVGSSLVINADALFASGPVDVTQAAVYTSGSGSANVFSIGSGGAVTANGNGVDLLNVSYGGIAATAQIAVGPCTYALNPSNQIVPNTGGTVAIQVTTQPGCAWAATGGAAWLPLTSASGSGNGAITLSATANNSGGTQLALVTLAGIQVFVTQPATACTYVLSQTQIDALAAGTSGSISVTTSCPVIASSDATWVTAAPSGSTVNYAVAVNNGTSQRTAILTIGTQPVSVVQGGNVTYTISGQVTLSGSGLSGVTMTISGSQNGTATTDGSGNYSFTVLESGTYTVTPSLAGCNFVPPSQPLTNVSTNQTANFVAQVDTSTSIVSSLNPSTYGNAVTFTATVAPAVGSGTPTGTVTFKKGSATLGTGTLSGGVATFTSTTLPVATNSITAVYGGNASSLTSTSAPLSQSVVQATTTTTLKSNANPALANQSVTLTATVTGQYGGNPTGTVTFYSNGVQIGSPGTVAARQASVTTSFPSPAVYSITAVYNGNTDFMPSPASPPLSETIYAPTAVPTTTSLKSSGSPSMVGQPVTFTATVKPALGSIPSGDHVTFYNGTASIGTGTTVSGVATLMTSSLPSGTDPITAAYAGDGTYLASTSAVVNQRVNKNTTATTVSSGLNPSTYGQSVTFTVTVSSAGPTPTGTVTFKNGSAAFGTGTLSGGMATLAYSKLAAGADSITAVYGGDTNSLNSTSAPLSQSVTQAATATAIAFSRNPSNPGQSVTFTAMPCIQ